MRRTRTYRTMQQAEQALADYRCAQLASGANAPAYMTLEEWLRYWMEEIVTPNCEETTCHGYENILSTHLIEEVSGFLGRAVLLHKGQIVGDAQLSDLEEQGQTLMDYVKSSYHYQSDRVSRALSDLTGKEDADA